MRTPVLFLIAFLIAAVAACAQSRAQFEVASVRPSEPVTNEVRVGLDVKGQQARITALPLSYYIAIAYDVKVSQVDGPDWLQNRFDVNATIPAGVTAEKLGEMLRGLLEERFGLKTHTESREMRAYALVRGKGPLQAQRAPDVPEEKSTFSAGGSGSSRGISVDLGNGASFTFADNKWVGKRLKFTEVADQLEQFVDLPIVDQTNLQGRYDLSLDLTAEDAQMMAVRASINAGFAVPPQLRQRLDSAQLASLHDAFEKLGLKLEAKKLAQPVIVVDQMSKTPTEN